MENNANIEVEIQFSLIQSYVPNTLTKTISLQDNKIQKKPVAHLTSGKSKTIRVTNINVFGKIIKRLRKNQALVFGITESYEADLVTKHEWDKLGNPKNPIARSKESFYWGGSGGFLLIDYDPQQGSKALSSLELIGLIKNVIPEIDDMAYLWWVSSSSCIHNVSTGEELSGVEGQRLYIAVKEAVDIPRAGKALFDRLWLSGNGWYEVSRSGALLERSIIDASVWQPNKLDFAAGADCVEPLIQKRGEPQVHTGKVMDSLSLIPDLNEVEHNKLRLIKDEKKKEVLTQQGVVKKAYIQSMSEDLVLKNCNLGEVATSIVESALEYNILLGDFQIVLGNDERISIEEILNSPEKYHGQETKDPLEPEYHSHKTVGKLYLFNGQPVLHSFAHGGRTFKLIKESERLKVVKGKSTNTTELTLEILKNIPDIFDRSNDLVKVSNGHIVILDEHSLGFWLGGYVQFYQTKKLRNESLMDENVDPPVRSIKQLISLGKNRNLKSLKAVITMPIIDADGYVVSNPGYDEKTQLFLDSFERKNIPEKISQSQVREAVEFLMLPFKDFPFSTNLDRTALLSGVLTAVIRPVLKTAPAFAFDAPVQGSGKTKLAKCLAILAGGDSQPVITPHTKSRDDEEIRKRLLTLVRTGNRYIIWDNVLGVFDSASIAGLLTSEKFSDRALGKNDLLEYPNQALFLLTGNNLLLAGDMPRRVITCRIDPQVEKPYSRKFDLDPEIYIYNNRSKMALAVIIIIKAWLDNNRNCERAPGQMASFEEWDEMVRQPIYWINQEIMRDKFGDVMDVVDNSYSNDPELEMLDVLLGGLRRVFRREAFKASDVTLSFNQDMISVREVLSGWSHGGSLSARTIGRVLKNREGRVVNGLRLVSFKSGGSLSYKVEAV